MHMICKSAFFQCLLLASFAISLPICPYWILYIRPYPRFTCMQSCKHTRVDRMQFGSLLYVCLSFIHQNYIYEILFSRRFIFIHFFSIYKYINMNVWSLRSECIVGFLYDSIGTLFASYHTHEVLKYAQLQFLMGAKMNPQMMFSDYSKESTQKCFKTNI